MTSCWLIEFKDGHKVIISESLYKEENESNFGGREVLCESHWFDFEVCRERNRGVIYTGFYGKDHPYGKVASSKLML